MTIQRSQGAQERIAEIARRVEAVPSGDYEFDRTGVVFAPGGRAHFAYISNHQSGQCGEYAARFVAHAASDIRYLLDALARLSSPASSESPVETEAVESQLAESARLQAEARAESASRLVAIMERDAEWTRLSRKYDDLFADKRRAEADLAVRTAERDGLSADYANLVRDYTVKVSALTCELAAARAEIARLTKEP